MKRENRPQRRTDQANTGSGKTRHWRTQSILHKSPSQLGTDLGLREAADDPPSVDDGSQP